MADGLTTNELLAVYSYDQTRQALHGDILKLGESLKESKEDVLNYFEVISKNLKSYPYIIEYDSDLVDRIVYDLGGGLQIIKTFNYTLDALTSIVLSGDVPDGVMLTKTINYELGVITSIEYS